MSMFDWVGLDHGNARFAGGIRGWDELGHETFGIELDGNTYYGEIAKVFAANEHDYNLEILSYGYAVREDVGLPAPESRETFSPTQAAEVEQLIRGLVAAVARWEEPPFILRQTESSHFLGGVGFSDGWIRVREAA